MKNWILGSAQFGFHYGITNSSGMTEREEVERTINAAKNHGASFIDTAAGYGLAEERIGNINSDLKIITKLAIKSELDLQSQLQDSLQRLKCNSVELVLIHDTDEFFKPDKLTANLASLQKIKDDGLCKKTGFSLYHPSQSKLLTQVIHPDVLQVPLNIWNQEFISSGELARLKTIGIEIHARSLFLQGVLLADSLPEGVDFMADTFSGWTQYLNNNELTAISACRSFAEKQTLVDCWILGFENKHQVDDFFQTSITDNDWTQLACSNPSIVDPSQWQTLKQSQ